MHPFIFRKTILNIVLSDVRSKNFDRTTPENATITNVIRDFFW